MFPKKCLLAAPIPFSNNSGSGSESEDSSLGEETEVHATKRRKVSVKGLAGDVERDYKEDWLRQVDWELVLAEDMRDLWSCGVDDLKRERKRMETL